MSIYRIDKWTCPNCLSKLTDNSQKVLCKKCKRKKCTLCHCACEVDQKGYVDIDFTIVILFACFVFLVIMATA